MPKIKFESEESKLEYYRNNMRGTVTSYNSGTGTLVVNITSVKGSGTKSAKMPDYRLLEELKQAGCLLHKKTKRE